MDREQASTWGTDLDGLLHRAALMRKHAGGIEEPVVFRKWEIVERIGAGGMGAVYLARDRELHRPVALKVIGGSKADPTISSTRLIREAQALAKVRHRNVLQIYSVDLQDAQPIIEMEYIGGPTLEDWVRDQDPSWRSIVSAYAAAGDGLSAIHEAKLVHRDIKPANLLRTPEGGVKVADLGLAVEPGARGGGGRPVHELGLGTRVTGTGAVVGTEGYFAPEVISDGTTSPASDQFALAASLHEALFGVLPFEGPTPADVADAMRTGSLTPPETRARGPGWLVQILRRALSFAPEDRYPTVAAMVTKLRRGLRRGPLGWLMGATVLAGTGLAGLGWSLKAPPIDECRDAGSELTAQWSNTVRAEHRRRIAAEQNHHVVRSYEVLEHVLDRRASEWVDVEQRLCSAARRAGADPEVLQAQRACLDYARYSLTALLGELEHLEGDRASAFVDATTGVERLPRCDDRLALAHWRTLWAEDPAWVERLAEAISLEAAGNYLAAESQLHSLVLEANQAPRRRAEALYQLGHVLGAQGRGVESFSALDEARSVAFEVGYTPLMCQAMTYQAKLAANVGLDPATSARELRMVEACAARTDMRSPLLRGDVLEAQGLLAMASGDAEEAIAQHRRALAIRHDFLGVAHPELAKSQHNLANALHEAGQLNLAATRFDEALAILEATLEANHPRIANVLLDRSQLRVTRNDIDLARRDLDRAFAIYQQLDGEWTPALANIHMMYARLDLMARRLEAAAEHLDRARDLQQTLHDLRPSHPEIAYRLHAEGLLAMLQGRGRLAYQRYKRATAILSSREQNGTATLDSILKELGALRLAKDHAALIATYEDGGEPLRLHVDGLEPSERGLFAWYLADAYRIQGQADASLVQFRQALDSYEQADTSSATTRSARAELRWEVARALPEAQRDDARRLARQAHDYFRGEKPSVILTEITRWIKEHPETNKDP